MIKWISAKNRVFMALVGPSGTGKSHLFYNWLKIGTFRSKHDKFFFFINTSNHYDVMQKQIDNLEFVQCVIIESIGSLKNNGTKYLLFFDDSCEKMCSLKKIVGFANAGRHCGLSTIYVKHNLFRQSKLGQEFELQNSQSVFFSNLLVTWCKSARFGQNWAWDQS